MKSISRYFLILIALIILSSIGLLSLGYGKHTIVNAGYATRFAWDTKPKPFNIKTHFYGKDLADEENCSLNGWSLSNSKFSKKKILSGYAGAGPAGAGAGARCKSKSITRRNILFDF